MTQVGPLTIAAGDGERFWYDGGLITFKATGAQTGGAFLFFEAMMPAGKATPLHVHPEADETFYVLEGEVQTHVEGVESSAPAGAVVVVPRGRAHAFRVSAGPARLLVLFTPADSVGEAFFREAGEPAAAPTLAPSDTPMERILAAAARTGMRVLGPPPFQAALA